jgi:hypothetical protein
MHYVTMQYEMRMKGITVLRGTDAHEDVELDLFQDITMGRRSPDSAQSWLTDRSYSTDDWVSVRRTRGRSGGCRTRLHSHCADPLRTSVPASLPGVWPHLDSYSTCSYCTIIQPRQAGNKMHIHPIL